MDENFTPTMYISYAEGGASVDMVNFYEENIAPYYGDQYSPTQCRFIGLQIPSCLAPTVTTAK